MQPFHWFPASRFRGGFTVHFVTISVFLVVLTAAAVAATLTNSIREQTEQQADRRLADGAGFFQESMEDTRTDLLAVGDWLSSEGSLRTAIRAGKAQDADADLNFAARIFVVDQVLLAGAAGTVFAHHSVRSTGLPPQSVAGEPGFLDAMQGHASAGIGLGTDTLEQRVYVPVRDGPTVIGVVRLVSLLDDEKLLHFRGRTGLDASLFYGQTRIETTLLGPQGPIRNVAANPAVVRSVLDEGRPTYSWRQLPSGRYRSYAIPLSDAAGAPVAMLSVSVPESLIAGELRATVLSAVPVTLLVVGVSAFLAYRVTLSVRRPVLALAAAAARLQAGDLATAVPSTDNPILSALGEQLEQARVRLQADIRALTTEEAWLRALLGSLTQPVLTTNESGRITGSNPAAEALFATDSPLAGASIADLLPFLPAPSSMSGDEAAFHGTHIREHERLDLEVHHSTVRNTDASVTHVFSVQDVSRHTELSRLREQLLYNVAHELRVPLTVLENALEILSHDYAELSAAEFDHLMKSSLRTATRLRNLMQNLLNAGVIQSGRFVPTITPVPLQPLIDDAVEAALAGLELRNQHVERDVNADVEVLADERFVSQVLTNLIDNASKYSPDGTTIRVSGTARDREVLVRVADEGRGIPQEQQEGLFDRFYRGPSEGQEPGIGLGLAIAKGIVEAHGGSIGIESAGGRGTEVWFTLPRATPVQPQYETAGAARRS